MKGTYRLPDDLKDDLAEFKAQTERFVAGDLSAAQFRAFRVPQGVYEQREENSFMLRVRFPAGGVLSHQMRKLADVSRQYGNGVLHVTTRQDIQVHSVGLEDIHCALVDLYGAGLSTKGGGGNTVRNITACFDAGVCPKEEFDVAPYAVAVTEFLLSDRLSFQLPRKYKIAFSACPQDCAGATVNDLGFIAKRRAGEPGFAVYVAGGMGAYSRIADPLEEFVPAGDIFFIAEAVKRVFDKHGNRKNRHKARLRFLLDKIGIDRLRELYEAELAKLRRDAPATPQVRELPADAARKQVPGADQSPPADGFDQWRSANVTPQKQQGYGLVQVPLTLGDIAADTLESLAQVVETHGEGMLRTTQSQNLVFRWVHENELARLHRALKQLGLADAAAAILRNAVACAGASTCKLGICLSRGLVKAITHTVTRDGIDLGSLGELSLRVSGCPNACGRHPVAALGFFGAARRIGGKLVPHYVCQLGGRVTEGASRLAEGTDAVPARNVPAFVADFLRAFQDCAEYPDFSAYLDAGGRGAAARIAAQYKEVPPFEQDANYYVDWDADVPFSLAGRGAGECGAGVFELIEVDLASAREALAEGQLLHATALAARALLVTQGQEAKDDAEALDLFDRYFIATGLVRSEHRELIAAARNSTRAHADLGAVSPQVSSFVGAVQDLYDNMDPSLRFKPAELAPSAADAPKPGETASQGGEPSVAADAEADFRGVVCPLNYVKTKLLLDKLDKGQVLSILLDEEGCKNVPESARGDGNEVLSVASEDDYWRVVLRKG